MSDVESEQPTVVVPTTEEETVAAIPSVPEPALLEAVKNQIEYYFSKENLLNDAFLTSQMDAQMSVPISVIMKFPKVKSLTQDEGVIRGALDGSIVVTIVDNRLKANIKPTGRSTIILREIPSDAAEEEVKEIFNFDGCKQISSIRSEIGDTWFVAMEDEVAAKDTIIDMRLKKRTFRGKTVKAGLKTETVVKSFYPVQNTPIAPPIFPIPGLMAYGGMMGIQGGMGMYGYGGMPNMNRNMNQFAMDPSAMNIAAANMANADGTASMQQGDNSAAPAAGSEVSTEASSTAASTGDDSYAITKDMKDASLSNQRKSNAPGKGGNNAQNTVSSQGDKNQSRGISNQQGVNANGRKTAAQSKDKKETKPSIEINSANFPPLHPAEDSPIPTPGYKDTPFIKYLWDDIIAIVKTVTEADAVLPKSFDPSAHPLSMDTHVHKDLLQRQRTFSIDETREQLNQGRPVTRDAVISGTKVDTRSLAWGDESLSRTGSLGNLSSVTGNVVYPSITTSTPITNAKAADFVPAAAKQAAAAASSAAAANAAKKAMSSTTTTPASTMAKNIQKNGTNTVAAPFTPAGGVGKTVPAAASASTEGSTAQSKAASTTVSTGAGFAVPSSSGKVASGLASPGEKKTISQSTWAAMLKTSAAATFDSPPLPQASTPTKKPLISTAPTSSAASKASTEQPTRPKTAGASGTRGAAVGSSAAGGAGTNGERGGDRGTSGGGGGSKSHGGSSGPNGAVSGGKERRRDRDRDRQGPRKEGAREGGDKEKEANVETTQPKADKIVQPAAPATTWGGKASFANILKTSAENGQSAFPAPPSSSSSNQPADEKPSTAATTTTSTPSTSSTTTTNSSSSNSSSSNSSSSNNSSSNRVSSNNNSGNNGNRSTAVSTDASGLWVKATLPSFDK
jgi:hypothetical protein